MTFVDLFVIVGARLESVVRCTSEKRSLGSPVAPHLTEWFDHLLICFTNFKYPLLSFLTDRIKDA